MVVVLHLRLWLEYIKITGDTLKTQHKIFKKSSTIPASAEDVFDWHTQPDALLKLTPPWIKCRVKPTRDGIHDGNRVLLKIRRGPICIDWLAEQRNVEIARRFEDIQIYGPFGYWHHVHRFIPIDSSHCILEDSIEYDMKLKPLLNPLAGLLVEPDLERLFAFRHAVTIAQFEKKPSNKF